MDEHAKGRQAPAPSRLPKPLSPKQNQTVKALRNIGRAKAQALGMAEELLGRKREVEACVREYEVAGVVSPAYAGWRSTLVGSDFQQILSEASPVP